MRSRMIGWLVSCLLSAQLVLCPQTTASRQGNASVDFARSKLHKHDRLRLVEARAQNKPNVTVFIAARTGATERVVDEIAKLNGTVQYRDDDVDYLRAQMPVGNVEKLSCSFAIEAINLAGKIDYLDYPSEETPTPAKSAANKFKPPGKDTPAINPYLPAGDIGAPQFIESHPTFDGRGVVIAIIDTNIDLLVPELQTAKALDGTVLPKFADIFTAAPNGISQTENDSQISGYLRVAMQSDSVAMNDKISYLGRTYTVPGNSAYRIGMLDERVSSSAGDLNRDGNPAGSNGLFTVLWEENTNTVWVDTNQNSDFTDDKPMTDYRSRQDIGIFGKDDPRTSIRETIGFTVQIDRQHKEVYVIPAYGAHGTGVAGVAAGNAFFGGKVNGVAPAAQIISIPYGPGTTITSSFIESVIVAVKDPRVDLVSMQFGNVVPLNDGRSTFSIVCDRLIECYQKPIFVAAGNGTDGLNAVHSPADAREVMAVGSYISNETSLINYGVELAARDNLNGYSSHGPTKEGRLKPNILAPTTSLTTRPGFLLGENRNGTYALPPGYQVSSGTSTSTPIAAAGAALLISAAKQSGVKYDPERLRWAMMTTARFLPSYSAELQGTGLLQLEAAWKALKNAPEPINIVSRAPVNAVLSEYLPEANQGTGIYEREGWTAGQSDRRTITFTRTSGKPGPLTFALRWIGNDDTFSCPAEIVLPLNVPVALEIVVSPRETGVHSALLNLALPSGLVIYQLMNTIVAAEQLEIKNAFTMNRAGSTDWPHSRSYFVNVPAGVSALRVDVRVAEGNVRPSLMKPNGNFYYLLAPDQAPVLYTRYQSSGSWSRMVNRPDPGVWQIIIDNCNLDNSVPRGRASFTVSATVLGVNMHASQQPSASRVFSRWKEVTYANSYGAFTGEIAQVGLASAFTSNLTLRRAEPLEFEIDVAPGASHVGAVLDTGEDNLSDLDLYLFDCTAGECVLRDCANGNESSAAVLVEKPAAGRWKIIIDPFALSAKGTTCQYKDYFLHSAFGRVHTEASPARVAPGATVTQRISTEITAVPLGARQLEALIFVHNEPGLNTADQNKNADLRLYYTERAILGTANVKLSVPSRGMTVRQ